MEKIFDSCFEEKHFLNKDFDYQRLLELEKLLSNALLKELFSMFLEECFELQEKCNLANDSNYILTAIDCLHKLQGTSINIGLVKTHRYSFELEKKVKLLQSTQSIQKFNFLEVQDACSKTFTIATEQTMYILNTANWR